MEEEKKRPVKNVISGSIKASIWLNEGTDKQGLPTKFYGVTFEKSYKDKSGEWKTTNNYNKNDLSNIAFVSQEVFSWIERNAILR